MNQHAVTLSGETVHNPNEPRHFMRLKPVARRVRILLGDEVIADSTRALRLLEIGQDVYDPVIYVPEEDVRARIFAVDGTTHCPIKGDAVYYDLVDVAGEVRRPRFAWSYPDPLSFAADLAGRIAFYPDGLTFEEGPS